MNFISQIILDSILIPIFMPTLLVQVILTTYLDHCNSLLMYLDAPSLTPLTFTLQTASITIFLEATLSRVTSLQGSPVTLLASHCLPFSYRMEPSSSPGTWWSLWSGCWHPLQTLNNLLGTFTHKQNRLASSTFHALIPNCTGPFVFILIWTPPEAEPGTRIWIQIVYLGENLRRQEWESEDFEIVKEE